MAGIGFIKALGRGARAFADKAAAAGRTLLQIAADLREFISGIDPLAALNIARMTEGLPGVSILQTNRDENIANASQGSAQRPGMFKANIYIGQVTWTDPITGEIQQFRTVIPSNEDLSLSEIRSELIRLARIQSQTLSPDVEGAQLVDDSGFDYELLYYYYR